jgi:dethiobiotin synthetase
MEKAVTTLLISGTDTGVGKTRVVSALGAYLNTYRPQQQFALFKPIQSGLGDREYYRQQFNLSQTLEQINPLYFAAPLVPPLAAAAEGKTVDLALAWQTFTHLRQSYAYVLIEGIGGLGSPITLELTVADLAHDWGLPTVLVVPVRLGAIGQAIAQAALAKQAQVQIQGFVLSCPEPCTPDELEQWASVPLIQSFTQYPVLGILPHLNPDTDLTCLAQISSQWDIPLLLPTTPVPMG